MPPCSGDIKQTSGSGGAKHFPMLLRSDPLPDVCFIYQRLLAELCPESLVLSVCVSTLDAEVELDLWLCT